MPRTAEDDLFEHLRPRLVAISRRIVGSDADAEDVVQDCWLKWRRAERDALQTPAAWLTTVVQHGAIDCLRRRAREAQVAAQDAGLVPPALPEDGLLLRAGLAEAFARMLARLSPAERMALVLHEAFECSHADVAAALGTTAVNARQYLARARRRLRSTDAQEPPADEKRCRELVRRFQAAINGRDMPALMALLADEQPVSVPVPAPRASANEACYALALAA